MKKFYIVGTVVALFIVGSAVAYAEGNGKKADITSKEVVQVQSSIEVQSQDKEKVLLDELKSYQVEKAEFNTLNSFVESTTNSWKEGAEYRRGYAEDRDAELTLVNATIHYINYFEKDITARGMTDEFQDWQITAYKLASGHKEGNWDEGLRAKYEEQMNQIKAELQ